MSLLLKASNGSKPYIWTFNNLPNGLIGDNKGKIMGRILQAGYYSFNALCSDSLGVTAESYYTLNIQPKSLLKSTHPFKISK